MLVWFTRGAAALFALLVVLMIVNALVLGKWQFWVAAVAFVVVAVGWVVLGNHWNVVNGAGLVVLDARTALTALVMVAAIVAAALSMSTLGD